MTPTEIVTISYSAYDRGDIDECVSYFSSDCKVEFGPVHLTGTDQLKQVFAMYHSAFPDGRHEFTNMVERGDSLAVEMVFTGTHKGPLYGPAGEIQPTGRKVTLKIADFFRLTDGKIVSYHGYSDQAAMAAQVTGEGADVAPID